MVDAYELLARGIRAELAAFLERNDPDGLRRWIRRRLRKFVTGGGLTLVWHGDAQNRPVYLRVEEPATSFGRVRGLEMRATWDLPGQTRGVATEVAFTNDQPVRHGFPDRPCFNFLGGSETYTPGAALV